MRPGTPARVATHCCLVLLVLIMLVPVVFAFVKSTQGLDQSLSPSIVPGGELWDNLRTVFSRFGLGRLMANTLLVVAVITVGKTVLSFLAASAFVYHRFPLRGPLFLAVLFTLMLPTEILIISLYDLMVDFGLYDTYAALIVPFLASATGTLLFRQHFLRIPGSLVEAARLDGAGVWRFIRSVLVPLSWNVIGALAVVEFVYVWNAYLWPLLVIQDGSRQVVQVGLSNLAIQQDVSHYGVIMAGVSVAMLPPIVVFLLLQEAFVRGFSLSTER